MKAESYLANYLEKFQELYATTAVLEARYADEMKEINIEFERAISKLKLLSIVHEKYVLAVSGFQGAGKTTLMNWFLFDNPSLNMQNWLPENQGVGENLPVLITCDRSKKAIEAVLYEVEKYDEKNQKNTENGSVKRTEILDPQECQKIVKKPLNKHLLVELVVPIPEVLLKKSSRTVVLDGTSFLLLPGFEIMDDYMDEDKLYRQEYMRLALRACANSIIVLDPRMVMQAEKENILKEITDIFNDTNALYVLTHSDQFNDTKADNYLRNKFKVKSEYIVQSGTKTDTYTRENIDQWRIALVEKISANLVSNSKLREAQRKNIEKLLRTCSRIIKDVKRLKDKIEIKNIDEELQLRQLFKRFEDSIQKIRSEFLTNYGDKTDSLMEEAFAQLENDNYNDDKLIKIWDWFESKIKGPEPISNIAKTFENAFNKQIEKNGGNKALLLKVYNKTQNDLGVYSDLRYEGDFITLKKDTLAKTIPQTEYQLSIGLIRNIQFLAGSDKIHESGKKVADPDKDFENALRILPYLVFDSQRLQLTGNGKNLLEVFEKNGAAAASDSFLEQFENSQIQIKSFLAGIASLVGADLLPDGQLDSIGSLFSALFGGSTVDGATAAAAGGTSVLGVTTGLAVGLVILQSMNNASIQYGLKKLGTLREIKNFQKDRIKQSMRKEFESTFQRVRNLIEFRLRNYAFNNSDLGYKLKMENRIQNCETAAIEIHEALRQDNE